GPLGLRFIKASEHYLSMMQGRDTCMIDVPMIRESFGWSEVFERVENALYKLGGRPHWGKINHISGAKIAELYPEYPKWQRSFDRMNSHGLFYNAFTERCGFSSSAAHL